MKIERLKSLYCCDTEVVVARYQFRHGKWKPSCPLGKEQIERTIAKDHRAAQRVTFLAAGMVLTTRAYPVLFHQQLAILHIYALLRDA